MDTALALGHLATALAIGLLLGVEREHDNAKDSTRPAGSRTFPLIAVAGAVSAAVSPVALGVALAAVGALVIAWYLRTTEPGATTEIAAIATFLLGALAWSRPELAVPVGVAAAALLAAKRPLHQFARKVVSDQDVRDAMMLFVVAFVVLPLLPNRPLGPSSRSRSSAGPATSRRGRSESAGGCWSPGSPAVSSPVRRRRR